MSRWKSRRFTAVGVALALALGVAACGSDDDSADSGGDEPSTTEPSSTEPSSTEPAASESEDLVIGFAWTDPGIEFYKGLIKGARDEAEALGYEVLESNNGGEVARQLADVSTWVGQGVTGVVVLPLDPAATTNIAAEAQAAGVIVVGYSDKIEGAEGSTTFDHPQGGADLGAHAANWINENLGGSAKIGLLTIDEMQVGRERIGGAMEVIERETSSEVVANVSAVSAADALPAVQSMLQANPDMNVVLCVADDGCIGAAQAYKAAGIDPAGVYIAGWDGAPSVLRALKDPNSYIKATAALPVEEIGRSVVYVVDNIRNGKEPVDKVHPYVIVDANSGQQLDDLLAPFG